MQIVRLTAHVWLQAGLELEVHVPDPQASPLLNVYNNRFVLSVVQYNVSPGEPLSTPRPCYKYV